MKIRNFVVILYFVSFAVFFFCPLAQAQYGGGSGTENDPYLIRTAEQMNVIGASQSDWGKHFQLRSDIDLSEYPGTSYNIIGTGSMNDSFTGVFDGNDHTISSLSLNSTRQNYTGLFGYVSGQVMNLGLINPEVFSQGSNVGALAGYLFAGTISNCYVEGANVFGDDYVGGLVGTCAGRLNKSYSTGSVMGDRYVGGLIGIVGDSTVNMCYSRADVSGQTEVGGLTGTTAHEQGVVNNCYATGNVQGGSYTGGLVGQVQAGRAFNCYSTGSVSGDQHIGGFTGYIRVLGSVIHCFWDTQTSGWSTSPGGTGRTTEEMRTITTFTNEGWDFRDIWTICDGMNYPVLLWQIPAADFLCPDGVNFIDFALFAQHWLDKPCGTANYYCQGTDLDHSGSVDFADLEIFAGNWLKGLP
ncbi:MAG: hypothetical protein JXA81_06105 [Sedimentisphaerales bacterium]|nr:hypothetical protein [Sedimentisphaerales bacterium]